MAAVFVAGDVVVYSASDLAAAARCEFAFLRHFDSKLGRVPPSPPRTICWCAPPSSGMNMKDAHSTGCATSSVRSRSSAIQHTPWLG
ncbi:hypothetical protein I551_7333 [Mycobacterium ulcerans str. Harvey]|uniref:Uncharacterized protein n=1 Tax=Mycobacterium ulcerans str. Harvey TaxID=1299332 RepID=A0ABP3A3Y9_MYCUL|nr:hypothetical protein I551_7333 [Mycobacterium ulcerans str. Harvey]